MPKVETSLAVQAEFESSLSWHRSKRGNLWRNWKGKTLTIFRRTGDGFFGWCIANEDERQFSSGGYETEADAMRALVSELGVGEFC